MSTCRNMTVDRTMTAVANAQTIRDRHGTVTVASVPVEHRVIKTTRVGKKLEIKLVRKAVRRRRE